MLNKLFKQNHRKYKEAFTRNRKLPFSAVITLILQKSMKSIQLLLNEMMFTLELETSVTNSAFTQARANLSHTAFIELNQKAVVDVMYRDDEIQRYKGFRLLAVDGSKVMLPNTPEVIEEFGQISYSIKKKRVRGKHAYGLASVLYDVLNNVAIDSVLAPAKSYEVNLAINHLYKTRDRDLLLYDRNYPSYFHIATLCSKEKNFVIRCSSASFKQAREMLKGKGDSSQIVTISPHQTKKKEIEEKGLPKSVLVRFVRVKLPTGEYEVIVTNLCNEKEFPTNDFLHIYKMRWGIESFYGVLKSRLMLENFSGTTVESIYQDFYSTIYISGIETILTEDVNESLDKKQTRNKQKVNHAVSFNAIKVKAFELFYSNEVSDHLLEQLEILFRMNPVQVKKDRYVPRVKRSDRHILHYHKRKKKICY